MTTIFQDNHSHSIPKKELDKVISRQPWTDEEKTHVAGLFRADSQGKVSGRTIDNTFKHLHLRKDHDLETHHINQLHKQLQVPFHTSLQNNPSFSRPSLKI